MRYTKYIYIIHNEMTLDWKQCIYVLYMCVQPVFCSSTFNLIFRPCFTPAVFCLMFVQLWRIWKLPTGFRGGWPPRGRPRLCDITGCCSKKVGFRYFFEETEKKGDIYGPKCRIDLKLVHVLCYDILKIYHEKKTCFGPIRNLFT